MNRIICLLLLCLSFLSCSPKLQSSGKFATNLEAETLKGKQQDLRDYKLVIAPEEFMGSLLRMGYFEGVMSYTTAHKMAKIKKEEVSYDSITAALKTFGKDTNYLVIEPAFQLGLANYSYLSLVNPRDGTVLFLSEIAEEPTIFREPLPLYNGLMEYLDENSFEKAGRSSEELLVPGFRYGFKYSGFIATSRPGTSSNGGLDFGMFGAFRFSRGLSVQLEVLPGIAFSSARTLNAFFLFKLHLLRKLDLHIGPQLSYYSDREDIIPDSEGARRHLNHWARNTAMGISYSFTPRLNMVFRYSKGVDTRGSHKGPVFLDIISLGFEHNL